MNLLFLTKFYPYGTGEAFIENEIEVLSAHFDNIYIVACDPQKKDVSARKLPKNVVCYKVPAGNKYKAMFVGLLNIIFHNKRLKEEKKTTKGIKQKAFLGYFDAKCDRIYKYIKNKTNLYECLNSDNPFVIYSYWMFTTAIVGLKIAEDKKPIYCFTRAHRYDLYENRNSLNYLPYRKAILEGYNMIFPCSDNGAKYLCEHYPLYSEKIQPAFLGTIDHGLGAEPAIGEFHIVSCSRIAPEKRVERIVSVLSHIQSQCYKIKWTHFGGGEGLEKIKEQAKKLTLIECEFLGNQPNSFVMDYYRETSVDLFLNVSSSEGLPVSIMEAMSFGIPVIATDVGGTNEIVKDEETGYLIKEDFTDEECSNLVERLIREKLNVTKECVLMRESCRRSWEENFQAKENYNSLCVFITAAINSGDLK